MAPFVFFHSLGRLLESAFGSKGYFVIYGTILFLAIVVYVCKAYYRETKLYKRIMGGKAKPYPYDEKGKRIYRWNGTPIEPPKEAEAAKEAEVAKEEVPENKNE